MARISLKELTGIPRKDKRYIVLYMKIYDAQLKRWAVEKLGRKCHDCSLISQFDCVYDFHHLGDESWSKYQNTATLSIEKRRQLVKWRKEGKIPEDVWLVCSNCHRIIHHSNQ
jgi:hypothetical protein